MQAESNSKDKEKMIGLVLLLLREEVCILSFLYYTFFAFLPPLTITKEEIDEGFKALTRSMSNI